ncbi:hypothetical protein [Aurantimonas sp. HBX-1]|uniref:hypothetical protein n=1 Tax=Aurantimonas sp. HBX-1 TaxID=2906072 RepID=UPI001F3E5859|nr:hypothetical protein [Aurantimonas sp. HBX-1]UIJ71038.1 hypothetical protein LXB15_15085 [Aurantimonas sp. HBX-1]
MKKFLAAMVVTLVVAAPVGMASAQDAAALPDLKGNWVGTSETVLMGSAAHHEDGEAGPRLSEMEFTMAVEGQDGRRFWGTITSAKSKEPFMGVIGFDGKSITARDTDGYIEGDLVDDGTMQLIYSHTGDSTVVAATTYTRKK